MTAWIANGNRTHSSMKIPPSALALAAGLAGVALLAGCGSSSTKTVTVTRTVAANTHETTTTTTSTPPTTTATSTSTSTAASAPSTSSTSATSSAPTASTTSTTSTRTETGPAFVVTNPSGGGGALAAAIALLSHKGYTAVGTASYRPANTLRVLIGRAAGGERAFFFDEATYLGTDATAASAHISVSAQSDTEVVLRYAIYRPGAQEPSATRLVHFALDMGKLNAIDSIPSVAQRR